MKTWHVVLLAVSIVAAAVGSALVRGLFDRYQATSPEYHVVYITDKVTGKTVAFTRGEATRGAQP